jgi:hypothetical protein
MRPADVQRHLVEPRAKRAVAAEAAERLEHPHEDLLRQILGVGIAAREPPAERHDAVLIPANERFEGVQIALDRCRQQVEVGIFRQDVSQTTPSRRSTG